MPMKLPVVWTALVAGLLGTVVIHSQTPEDVEDPFAPPPDPKLPRTVRVHAEFIEMPMATYSELVSKPRSSANNSDLRAKCTELIEQGEARILESLCVNAVPGQNATSESIGEYVYQKDYNTSKQGPPINLNQPSLGAPVSILPPRTFETKNTGSSFEVEAQIDFNDAIVELRVAPTLVALAKSFGWETKLTPKTSAQKIMPMFYVMSFETGLTLVRGEPCFIASLSPRGDDGFTDFSRKVMVFLRADILTSKQ